VAGHDPSHFGEQRSGIRYKAFMRDVAKKNEALSIIYHMIILREIGIDENMIGKWLYTRSFSAKPYHVEAGLLDGSVLKPATLSSPIPIHELPIMQSGAQTAAETHDRYIPVRTKRGYS
jgi:hypothetical protein